MPVTMPTEMPARMGSPAPSPCGRAVRAMARIAPTERSIPPAMMIMVMPSAMMLITAVWRTTLERLVVGEEMRRCDGEADEQHDEGEERQQALDHGVSRPSRTAWRMISSWEVRRGSSAVMRPCAHDEDAVGDLQEFGQFGADHQDGGARAGQFVHQLRRLPSWRRCRCRAWARRRDTRDAPRTSHLAMHDLLLIAPAEPAGQLARRTSLQAQAAGLILR